MKNALLLEARPQETASFRRSDFVIKVMLQDNTEFLVLIEFVSYWKPYLPLRTLECRCRHILEENLPVKTFIFLLTPSYQAIEFYQDEEVRYKYNLIKLYEMDARKVLDESVTCLYPFVPVMKGGEEVVYEADKKIYESELPKDEKADYLTGLTIFAGLKSRELVLELIKRRRDIMIESPAFEIIKQLGYKEGLKAGIQQGMQQGIQQGIQQGKIEGLLRGIELGLKIKFGIEGIKLLPRIKKIKDIYLLEAISDVIETAENVSQIEELLKNQG